MTCHCHVRPWLPDRAFVDHKFHCLICGEYVDPKDHPWTSIEFVSRKAKGWVSQRKLDVPKQ